MKEMADDRLEVWHTQQQKTMRVFDDPIPKSAWTAEFDPPQSPSNALLVQTTSPHGPSFMTSVGMNRQSVPMGIYSINPPLGLDQGNYTNNAVYEGKGKGKQREVDFEAAFAQAVASLSPSQTDTSTEDEVADVTKALDNTSLASPDSETEDGMEFPQLVSFKLRSWEYLIKYNIAFGTNSRTPTCLHRRKICQNGNLNLIS